MNKKTTIYILIATLMLVISSILLCIITKQVLVKSKNNIENIVIVTDSEVEWRSEGGVINGLYNGKSLFCIEANFYRSMFQTNEKYYIYDNLIYYEMTQYIYEVPMDTSRISVKQDTFIIINDKIYRREYDEQANKDIFVLYDEKNSIIENLEEYIQMLEGSYKK